jgi:phosphoglycerate dehydrogenase-like enzyme
MKILLIGTFAAAGQPLLERFLRTTCEIIPFGGRFEEDAILRQIPDADVVVGAPFTGNMAACARRLRLIQNTGTGLDRYDLSSFPKGARLCVCYDHESGMAEYVIMAMLALSRRLLTFDSQLRQGFWTGSCIFSPFAAAPELRNRVVGMIGYGRIGREVARRIGAFGMRCRAIKGRPDGTSAPELEWLAGPAALDQLLAVSDYVVVSCPLSTATHGMIGEEQFGMMKPNAYLVNVSRGRIIQERALYEALRDKRIAGAAIDVWYRYPEAGSPGPCSPSAYPFYELDNVIMTPHISCCTEETAEARWRDIAFNIDQLDVGGPLRNEVRHAE